jgi:hypothetical protein
VLVNQESGELKLLVKINAKAQGAEAKKSKAVKDLKQLSGETGYNMSRLLCCFHEALVCACMGGKYIDCGLLRQPKATGKVPGPASNLCWKGSRRVANHGMHSSLPSCMTVQSAQYE